MITLVSNMFEVIILMILVVSYTVGMNSKLQSPQINSYSLELVLQVLPCYTIHRSAINIEQLSILFTNILQEYLCTASIYYMQSTKPDGVFLEVHSVLKTHDSVLRNSLPLSPNRYHNKLTYFERRFCVNMNTKQVSTAVQPMFHQAMISDLRIILHSISHSPWVSYLFRS